MDYNSPGCDITRGVQTLYFDLSAIGAMAESAFNKIDLLKDAEEYVESLMSAHGASIVRTPATNIGARKRLALYA